MAHIKVVRHNMDKNSANYPLGHVMVREFYVNVPIIVEMREDKQYPQVVDPIYNIIKHLGHKYRFICNVDKKDVDYDYYVFID